MLHIRDLTYRIAGRPLFEGASLTLPGGHHAGLVGRNGTGKTTLLRLIAGELHADGGSIGLPNHCRIGMVAQEAPDGPRSLLDAVLAADAERSRLLAEAASAKDHHRIAEMHDRLTDIGAHSAPARAASILAGLGFDAEAQARPCGDLSGGWRMRVALAAVLFAEPDLLLLDEPTNHLDLEATLWLESYLKSYPHTLLLVSHDRDLLNRAVDKIVHLEGGRLAVYSGGYDRFERTRNERLAHQTARASRQLAQRRHMQTFIDRFRYKASKARQAQSRLKALVRMEPIASVSEARTATFGFPTPEPLASPILALDDAAVGYQPGRAVLSRLTLRLDSDDRIALIGANGNGKSTLVKLLSGRLAAQSGEVRKSPKLRVGYFAQHQADELDLDATPLQLMERLDPRAAEQMRRGHLGRFGFGANLAATAVRALSGGEKARLLLALMSRAAPHVLMLDEPSNHLDVDARQALVQAVNSFEGAVVLITHDAHLIELTADRLWLVANGGASTFEGDLDDYRRLLRDEQRERKAGNGRPSTPSRKQERRQAADARAAVAHLKRAAIDAEKRLLRLQARRAALEQRLADPAVYRGPTRELLELQVELSQLKKDNAAAEEAWLQAQQVLETGDA